MVVFSPWDDLDSTQWVEFSNKFQNTCRDIPHQTTNRNNHQEMPQKEMVEDTRPPQLSLPLDHYCVIAENVFISFLKLYRSVYALNPTKSVSTTTATAATETTTAAAATKSTNGIKDVTLLGNRLEAFLTVVLPYHSDYGSEHRMRETCRIRDMTKQLRDYLDRLSGKELEEMNRIPTASLHCQILGLIESSLRRE